MSFFTSLTGLNAATTQLSVTSNNIANAGTTGFKRSRSDFGDIFATSPLQKASTVVGQGTALKQVTQEFSQGNIELSGNSLDLAVTGEGFFPLRSSDGQDLFTRNGSFLLDEQNTVVNSAGQYLKVASVDSLGKADFKAELVPLTINPATIGEAIASSEIDFNINFPAESLPLTVVDENGLEKIKDFNPNDATTYAKSAAITIYDENGNDFLLTFYYRRVQVASAAEPSNKWQTHVVLGGQEIQPALGQATTSDGTPLFVDKYGAIVPEDELPVVLNDNLVFSKFNLDDLSDPDVSVPATAISGLVEMPYLSDEAGVNFAAVNASQTLSIDADELANISKNDVIELQMTDDDGVSLGILTTRAVASARLTLVDNDQIEAGDVVSLTLVDDNEFTQTITTAGLVADLNASEITALNVVDALNAAHSAKTNIDVTNIGTIAFPDSVEFVVTDSDGVRARLRTPPGFANGGAAQTIADLAAALDAQQFSVEKSIDLANLDVVANGEQISFEVQDEDGNAVTLTTGVIADVTDLAMADVVTLMNADAEANGYAYTISSVNNTLLVTHTSETPFIVSDAEDNGFNLVADATFTMNSTGASDPYTVAVNAGSIEILSNNDKSFRVSIGANHSVLVGTTTFSENISAVTPTLMTTADTDLVPFYTFSVPEEMTSTDEDPIYINPSMIQVTRQDGTNFNMALSSDHDLGGDAALFQHIGIYDSEEETIDSGELTQSATAFTKNGYELSTASSVSQIVEALQRSAAGTDFSVMIDPANATSIKVSNETGINFQVGTSRVPGATTNLISGILANGSQATITDTILTAVSTDGSLAPDLSAAFDLTIDEDPEDKIATDSLTIDLSVLSDPENSALSGSEVATLMTQEINRQFGDQRYFDLSSDASRQFRMTFDPLNEDPKIIDIYLPESEFYTSDTLATAIEAKLQAATGTHIGVRYSNNVKGFVFSPDNDATKLRITNVPAEASLTGSAVPNVLFGLDTLSTNFLLGSTGTYPAEVISNGETILSDEGDERFGIKVNFLPNTEEGGTGGSFTIASGQTGDNSAIRIENISDAAKQYFGFDPDNASAVLEVIAESGASAVRGVQSTAAKVFGKPVSVDPDETFFIDDLSNQFTVTADSVSETFRLPVGNYNLNSFKNALQNRINAMEDARGNSISGVRVDFDQTNEIFNFTSGTTGDSSFFQISGSARFGLQGIESNVGQTSTFRPPVAEQTANGRPVYVTKDENGVFREYSTDTTTGLSELPGSREFNNDPEYRPLFLDKGELTFDTAGNLISPLGGISLDNVVIGGSGNTLNIDIAYIGSTQFSGDFSVNSQGQNGQPNGSLVAVDIADDGLVTASYSNGTQDLKGKIVLATFSTPNGLRQLGDSTFLESNESGTPSLGEPGGAGFGTIRAGARERANVDLTSELVDLITAQRNFQANAKAIETSSTLTSTIINIRS
ncbi:flagellar hook-basal body complex protein [Litorivicinus sp.]|nr:flagellar hook-basal body complex protein [Litorivicinus sp.]